MVVITPHFVIKGTNGNVGIGTTNPSANLHTYSASFDNGGFSAKFARNVTDGQHNGIGLGTANNVIKSAIFQERTSAYQSKLHLCHNGTNDSTDVALSNAALTIHDGNVGIGTTDPGAKLDVNGALNVNGDLTVNSPNEIYYKGQKLDDRFNSLATDYYYRNRK